MDDSRTFVKLKYQILTSDKTTWHLCKTYPHRVLVKWAMRCIIGTPHPIFKNINTKIILNYARLWLDGRVSDEEIIEIPVHRDYPVIASHLIWFICIKTDEDVIHHIIEKLIKIQEYNSIEKINKQWKQYTLWLEDELYDYELNQQLKDEK